MYRHERVPPGVALAVAVLAVSLAAPLIRLSDAPKPAMAFWRVALTAGLLVPFLRGQAGDLRALSRRDAARSVLAGLALAVHFAAWFVSVGLTTVAASVTLVQTQPLFVAVGGAFLLDERVGRRVVVGLVVATAGAAAMSAGELIAGGASGATLTGNALALVGALAAAAYVLAGRSVRQRVALVPYVLVVYAVCAAGLLALALARGDPILAYPPREWALFAAMAVGPGVFGHTVINWALAHLESAVVSLTFLGEPVGSSVLAFLLFSEVPGPATAAGGALVLGGVGLAATRR